MPAVNVVAQHKYEIKMKYFARSVHLRGDFVLRQLSRPHVADYSKTHGVRFQRQDQFLAVKRQSHRSQSHTGNEVPARDMHSLKLSRNGVRDEVHNQIRLGILQNKGMADDAIRQFLRQDG